MLVGGCVRDELLGVVANDYDIASDALPETVQKLFNSTEQENWRAIPSGIEHGTITLLSIRENFTFEVTSLRQDQTCDGRHADVVFGRSFYEDSCRRDFTINALYQDVWGHIYDFHNGLEDLSAGKLCFIGEPSKRIQEDHLRILRYFRFLAKFQLKANSTDLKIIKQYSAALKSLTQERITQELLKILSCTKIAQIVTMMDDCEIFTYLFPPEKFYKFAKIPPESLDLFDLNANSAPLLAEDVALMRFTLLLNPKDNVKNFELIENSKNFLRQLHYLRLSSKQINFIEALNFGYRNLLKLNDSAKTSDILLFTEALDKIANRPNFFKNIFYRFMKNILNVSDNLAIHLKTLEYFLRQEREFAWRKKAMPIDGYSLQELFKISAGPRVGSLLEELRRKYLDGEWSTIEELKKLNLKH